MRRADVRRNSGGRVLLICGFGTGDADDICGFGTGDADEWGHA